VYFAPPLTGSPWNWVSAQGQKNRNDGLPDGQESFRIGLAVQTQYWRVTDIQPSSHLSTAKTALAHCVRRAGNKKLSYR